MIAQIVAFFQGLKAIAQIVQSIENMYDKYQDSKIEKHYAQKKKTRNRLTAQLKTELEKRSPSDAILRDLHRKLSDLKSNEL